MQKNKTIGISFIRQSSRIKNSSIKSSSIKSSIVICAFLLFACGSDNDPVQAPTPPPAPVNLAPSVSAGNDFTADEQTQVSLSATASDSDGSINTFAWRQTAGQTVQLSAVDQQNASFTAPTLTQSETLSFEITVTDNDGAPASDTISVTIDPVNEAPTAQAGVDRTVNVNDMVMMSGANSSDPDGDTLSYTWTLQVPNSSSAALSASDIINPTFTPDVVGDFIIGLIVNDGTVDSSVSTVTISAQQPNRVPIANAGPAQSVTAGDEVTLDGSGSSDQDNDTLSYLWTLQSPTGSSSSLSDNTAIMPRFTPDIAGSYQATLVVSDGEASSVADLVVVTATDAPMTQEVDVRGNIYLLNDRLRQIQANAQDVNVVLTLLDEQDQILDTIDIDALQINNVQELSYAHVVEATTAAYISLSISHDNASSFVRRLPVSTSMLIDARLIQLDQQSLTRNTITSIDGQTIDGFSFVADNSEYSVIIPADYFAANTNEINVGAIAFDSTSIEGIESFPGDYADSNGDELVSVGFSYAAFFDENGTPLALNQNQTLNEQHLSKPANTSTNKWIITQGLNLQQCLIIDTLGDTNDINGGFQIPFFSMDPKTGLWVLIGEGTIYQNSGVRYDGGQLDCENNDFSVIVNLNPEVFRPGWWNIDYNINFTDPVFTCAEVEIIGEDLSPLEGVIGYVADVDASVSFTSTHFATNEHGLARFQVRQFTNTIDLDGDIRFNQLSGINFVGKPVTMSENCEQPPRTTIELERVPLCELEGMTSHETGVPALNSLIYAVPLAALPVNLAITESDGQGQYSMKIACDLDYRIIDFTAAFTSDNPQTDYVREINIDGVVDPGEISDDGEKVVVERFEIGYHEPIIQLDYDAVAENLLVESFATISSYPLTVEVRIFNDTSEFFNETFEVTGGDPVLGQPSLFWAIKGTTNFDFVLPTNVTAQFQTVVTDRFGNEFISEISGF